MPRSVDELWLDILNEIGARAAHEIKGALNGVSVNLEVVRSRAQKPEAPAAAVASFATSASEQLESVIEMTEALLTLTRAAREPVEIVPTVRRLAALLAPTARAEGGSLAVEEVSSTAGKGIRTRGNVVRLAIAAALLAALRGGGAVRCRIETAHALHVHVERLDGAGGAPRLAREVAEAAAEAGVEVSVNSRGISLAFPRVASTRRTHETA